MRNKFIISLVAFALLSMLSVSAKNIFVVEGPEDSYNQIRVVNETSQKDFKCRVVILNEDETTNRMYGVYYFKEIDSSASKSDINRVQRGSKVAIQMPKDFPTEMSYYVEYKDYPFFDIIVIHLTDNKSEFNEE